MSGTWKWILGITLGLVILAGVGFAAAYYFGFGHMSIRVGPAYAGHPMMDDYGFGNRVPMNGYRGFRHPMMSGRGFYPFGGFFFLGGLLRLVFPLAVLVAVGYFSYRAGKRAGSAAAQNSSEMEPAIETVVEPEESPKKRGRKVA